MKKREDERKAIVIASPSVPYAYLKELVIHYSSWFDGHTIGET